MSQEEVNSKNGEEEFVFPTGTMIAADGKIDMRGKKLSFKKKAKKSKNNNIGPQGGYEWWGRHRNLQANVVGSQGLVVMGRLSSR